MKEDNQNAWRDIKALLPEHGDVWIYAPDETPEQVVGRLAPVEQDDGSDPVEWYVEYAEEMMNDCHGEIINPTHWQPLPPPPSTKALS